MRSPSSSPARPTRPGYSAKRRRARSAAKIATRRLPASFINREGLWESGPELPSENESAPVFRTTTPGFQSPTDPQPLPAARNWLRRALAETGQLVMAAADGRSYIWFAGVGDPDRLVVEVVTSGVSPAETEPDFSGCLCSLRRADGILGRVYRGESTAGLIALLDRFRRNSAREVLVL